MYNLRIEKAIQVSAHAHRKQYRKSNNEIPYIVHPYSVFLILLEHTKDEDILIASLLHDVLEDSDPEEYDEKKLTNLFGEKVVSIIKEVSEKKDGNLNNKNAKLNWEERKVLYLSHLQESSDEAIMIAIADKIHNLSNTLSDLETLGEKAWTSFNAPKEKQIWFFKNFSEIVNQRTQTILAEKLNYLVKKIEEIA